MMKSVNKRYIRDLLRLCYSMLCFVLYIPHSLLYLCNHRKRSVIKTDLDAIKHQVSLQNLPPYIHLIYQLHTNRFFRSLFYHRIGPIWHLLIGWYRPGERSFVLPDSTIIGSGLSFAHPFSTILNAESIGDNFNCLQNTTIGKKAPGERRPRIGNCVTVGCHVAIIGDISIGNNVTIGAGCIVVKDIPDNAVVVGNPAKIIKYNEK